MRQRSDIKFFLLTKQPQRAKNCLPKKGRKLTVEISKENYDRWRYYYPKYDTTQIWTKVPAQELSDVLIELFKDKIEDK